MEPRRNHHDQQARAAPTRAEANRARRGRIGRIVRNVCRVDLPKGGHLIVLECTDGVGFSINDGDPNGGAVLFTASEAGRVERGISRALIHMSHPEVADLLDAGNVKGAAEAILGVSA